MVTEKQVTGRNERVNKKVQKYSPFHSTPLPCNTGIFKEQKPKSFVNCGAWFNPAQTGSEL